jgi:hypothetical protein
MKWAEHPNLRHRPERPALGRGRLQRAVMRGFIAASGRPDGVPMNIFLDFCYPRKRLLGKRLSQRHRYSIWRTLKAMGAKPIGHTRPYGATLWKLPDATRSVAKG